MTRGGENRTLAAIAPSHVFHRWLGIIGSSLKPKNLIIDIYLTNNRLHDSHGRRLIELMSFETFKYIDIHSFFFF